MHSNHIGCMPHSAHEVLLCSKGQLVLMYTMKQSACVRLCMCLSVSMCLCVSPLLSSPHAHRHSISSLHLMPIVTASSEHRQRLEVTDTLVAQLLESPYEGTSAHASV